MVKYSHKQSISNVNVSKYNKIYDFGYPCENYYSCSPYKIFLRPGAYILEVWGAHGQNYFNIETKTYGGKGGYSVGAYIIKEPKTLYLHVGGTPSDTKSESHGSYNGGGGGANLEDGAGGGATDFRTEEGDWNKGEKSFKSRIIVAGAGGGAYYYGQLFSQGGDGGGETGTSISYNENKPCVGSQNGCINGTDSNRMGKLGIGNSKYYGSGGGGYWGGGSAYGCGGGGGSGYIGGVTSIDKIEAKTIPGINDGYAKARITVIYEQSYCTAIMKRASPDLIHFIILLVYSV